MYTKGWTLSEYLRSVMLSAKIKKSYIWTWVEKDSLNFKLPLKKMFETTGTTLY